MADTAMMNLFLEHVARAFMAYFTVMEVDQAGWHQAKALKAPENIRLIPQQASGEDTVFIIGQDLIGRACSLRRTPLHKSLEID
jgi:hypothetical protein